MPDFFKSVNKRVNRPSAVKQVGLPPFMVRKNPDLSPYLLDQFSGAAAAYSVRRLSSNYSGSALRVRRASDNAEVDIGFIGENLDTARLEAHCAGTDGFVVTWYDQSGNGNNATNATSTQQPQIVSGGVIFKENNVTCLRPVDGNSELLTSTIGSANAYGFYTIKAPTVTGAWLGSVLYSNGPFVLAEGAGRTAASQNVTTNYSSLFINGSTLSGTNQGEINSAIQNQSLVTISIDDSGITPNISIGFPTTSSFSLPVIQEFIRYHSNQDSNRSSIERNINRYFNIYWDGSRQGILDTYSGASAAYSVRALNSAYTGPLLRVRRSSDNAEKDIYALYDGNLDTASMEAFCPAQDGFVVTWYDQSGNGNNANNSTASQQPQIISLGTTIKINSITSIDFDTDDNLSFTDVTPLTTFTVAKIDALSLLNYILYNLGANKGYVYGGTLGGADGIGVFDGALKTISGEDLNRHLAYYHYASTLYQVAKDGGSATNLAAGSNFAINQIGRSTSGLSFNGKIQEVIIYETDNSANKSAIESNTNEYYAIY